SSDLDHLGSVLVLSRDDEDTASDVRRLLAGRFCRFIGDLRDLPSIIGRNVVCDDTVRLGGAQAYHLLAQRGDINPRGCGRNARQAKTADVVWANAGGHLFACQSLLEKGKRLTHTSDRLLEWYAVPVLDYRW